MPPAFIYGLFDQRTPTDIRYVGWTVDPVARLRMHRLEKNARLHKVHWVQKVMRSGSDIGLSILEECTTDNWSARERFWIARLRADGNNLTNGTDGGEGVLGLKRDQKTRERDRLAQLGKKMSTSAKFKISQALMGHDVSPGTRAAISAGNRGKVRTPETKAKISQSLQGNTPWNKGLAGQGTGHVCTIETRAKIAAAQHEFQRRKREATNE